ncbi:hypothetical protein BDZ89DRAFT_1153394 [Hymenopellis radicata]|nr:hypothetical protein BDZ89DRAFT_1153394 [Hymenopellis radicata]
MFSRWHSSLFPSCGPASRTFLLRAPFPFLPVKNTRRVSPRATHWCRVDQRQLLQTLFKYHVKPFDPTGDVFDPNRHDALYQAPIPGKEPGTVIDCQKNRLHDQGPCPSRSPGWCSTGDILIICL